MPRGKRRSSKSNKSGKVKGATSPGKVASTVLGAGVGAVIGTARGGVVGGVLGAALGGLTGHEAGTRAETAAKDPKMQRQSTDKANPSRTGGR